MNRVILLAIGLALVLSVPALSGDDSDVELATKVEKLEKTVAAQKAALADLQKYVGKQKAEAAKLGQALAKAEKGGFLYPAPHVDAKKALLDGLKQYAKSAAGAKEKK